MLSTLAFRIDSSHRNTWKVYLTDDGLIRRKPIGRVLWKENVGFWAEYILDGALALTGPFPQLELAAKVVAQNSYETPAPFLSRAAFHDMPRA